jgi:hypothetical protein
MSRVVEYVFWDSRVVVYAFLGVKVNFLVVLDNQWNEKSSLGRGR